jgi:uncharacterized protein
VVRTVLILSAAVAGSAAFVLSAIERSYIYFPAAEVTATPADVGLDYEDVVFPASDGTPLHGWFVPGTGDPPMLWFHGNGGNMSNRVELLRVLHDELHVPIFLFDYRGYGASAGRPSEQGTYRDAEGALEALAERTGSGPGRMLYFGQSLGAAVAVELAVRRLPLGVILESPFTSIRDMAATHYPSHPLRPFVRSRYNSLGKIRRIGAPLLVLHGDRDEVTPVWMGRRLHEAAAEPKELHVVPGAAHDDLHGIGGPGYLAAFRRFVGRLSRPAG